MQRSNCTVPAQEVETFVEESQAAQNARSLHAAGGRRQGLHESVSAFFLESCEMRGSSLRDLEKIVIHF